MKQEEYDQLDELDKIIYNYTYKEIKIYGENTFEELLKKYPNNEEMKVYRGINFATRLDYYKFMKKFNEDGGFIKKNVLTGFSPSMETAVDFALSSKTYFPTMDIIQRESIRLNKSEYISGFCGILLTTKIKENTVIDLRNTGFQCESEVLFRPSTLIKCELKVFDSFENTINNNNFNINEYILNVNDTNDPIFNYITINHAEKINKESSNHILKLCIKKIKDNESKIDFIHETDFFAIAEEKKYKNYRLHQIEKNYTIYVPSSIEVYEKRGCFRIDDYSKIDSIANELVEKFLKIHKELKEKNPEIKFKNYGSISWFVQFTEEKLKNKYKEEIINPKGSEYHDLNNKFKDLNKNLSEKEKLDLIENIKKDIKSVLEGIISDNIPNKNKITKRLSKKD